MKMVTLIKKINFRLYSTSAISSLFISDSKSATVRPILKPEPNFEEKLKDIDKLNNNLKTRNLPTVDSQSFQSLFHLFKTLHSNKEILESRKEEIAEQVKKLKKVKDVAADGKNEIEKLKLHGKMIREDLKALMKAFWDVEERLMFDVLALPNQLHSDTTEISTILYELKSTPTNETRNHLEIGKANNLIDYRDPNTVYLLNAAALFEFSYHNFFLKQMKNHGFIPTVTPDFVNPVIVEGSATSKDQIISVTNPPRTFIVGGASSLPMYALYCKQTIQTEKLPLRHIHFGRLYHQPNNKIGLYGSTQHTCLSFFTVLESDQALNAELHKTSEILKGIYSKIGFGLRIVCIAACDLKPWESLRMSFQLYSPYLNEHLEVASISVTGSFISERLLIKHGSDKLMCFVLTGTVADLTSLIGVALEQGSDLLPRFEY